MIRQKVFKCLSCEIKLDGNRRTYKPGDNISGTCLINVHEKIYCKAMAVVVCGFASINMQPSSSGNKDQSFCCSVAAVAHTILEKRPEAKRSLLRAEQPFQPFYILHENQKSAERFNIELPLSTPTSFQGQFGKIFYEIALYVTHFDNNYEKGTEKLVIKPRLNLALDLSLRDPLCFSTSEGNILSTFTKKDKKSRFTFEASTRGFMTGKKIPFKLVVYNPEKKSVKKLSVILLKMTKYKRYGDVFVETKTTQEVVSKVEKEDVTELIEQHKLAVADGTSVATSEEIKWNPSSGAYLDIPKDLCHSHYSFLQFWKEFGVMAKLINHSYEMKVEVHFADQRAVLRGQTPVIVGTEWDERAAAALLTRSDSESGVSRNGIVHFDTAQMEPRLLPAYSDLSLLSIETLPPTYEEALKIRQQQNEAGSSTQIRTPLKSSEAKYEVDSGPINWIKALSL